MRIQIAPSILSADFGRLAREIESVESGGADLLHLDVMDGHFVPNITIGPPVVASIRQVTNLPLDVHLMIEEPSRYLDDFIRAGANWISVHIEADPHLHRTLSYLRREGVKAGVALNPATPVGAVEDALGEADFVLVMSVNPGFGGQEFIPHALKKIRKLKEMITSYKCRAQIQVDGGIGPDNLREVITAGGEIMVAGSAVFRSKESALKALQELRGIADAFSPILEQT